MMKKYMRRAAVSSAIALVLAVTPAVAMAAETETAQTEAAEGIESILATSEELMESAVQQVQTGHEGYLSVKIGDPVRAMIAEEAGGLDDMSWIQDAKIVLQERANGSGGADLETTLFFNDMELYHLQLSFDAEEMVLYALCPELLDKAMAIPVGELSTGMEDVMPVQISPELLGAGKELMGEFIEFIESIPPQTIQKEIMNYVMTLGSYLQTEEGTAAVTAGTLQTNADTVTYKITSEAMQKMVPQLMRMLSQDELLEQAMKSSFVNHLISLASQQSGMDLGISGDNLYTLVQSQLEQLAEKDYSELFGFILTVGTSQEGIPARLSLALEMDGVTAELFCFDIVVDGAEHAAEFKIGPVLAGSMGLTDTDQASILLQGSAEQNMLNETLSLNLNGDPTPVFLISGLDLEQLEQGRVVGTFTLNTDEGSFTWDYSVAEEDDSRVMDLYVNEDLWISAAMNLYETSDVDIDVIDTSEAIKVYDEESLAAYMRDANVISMLEKLSDAGVPQEYVDMLTSGEASTESSRENTEEKDIAS